MTLAPGTKLGAYEVVALLGAGGMGEVWRARDSRLGRDVAIKVLPESLASDAERLARFDREARLLAAMNHPGIAAIYGLEDSGGRPALVMELVEGPTLAERLERGALPVEEALAVARALAEALEYAHDLGIVHRDLKPANVKVRPDGAVKVLDFGLARALDTAPAGSSGDLTQSPTVTHRMTSAGVILGTAAYMSPEQARGRAADRRADVWAFGVVLYEMLAGRRAFAGETLSDTLAAVMRDEPDWSALPAGLAPSWRALLGRCLAKDPKARLQAIGEARIALGDPAAMVSGVRAPAPAAAPPARRSPLVPLLAAVTLVLAAALGWLATHRAGGAPAVREVDVALPWDASFAESRSETFFAIAPDGRSIAYSARAGGAVRLRVRELGRRAETELPGTDNARSPFYSPDGEWIGFFDGLSMRKVSVHGGQPVTLAEAGQDRGGTWLDDGTIVFAPLATSPLMRMPASGGAAIAVSTLDTTKQERTHRFPVALAGGPWVAFTVGSTNSPGGYDDAPIDVVNVKTGERRPLVKGGRFAAWSPSGHLVFARGTDLFALRVDPRDPRPLGEPLPVMQGVAGETSSGVSMFAIAGDGTLAWIPADPHENERVLAWFDRGGRATPLPVAAGPYVKVTVSADAMRALVLAGVGGGSTDLWLADLAHGGLTRLTYNNTANPGLWLPGGERIVYPRFDADGGYSIVVRRLDGAGGERTLYRSAVPLMACSLSPDGRQVVIADYGLRNGRLRVANVDGDPAVRELPVDGPDGTAEQAGVISPDGRWLAYVSSKTRREEVFVRSLAGGGGRWQVSTGGGGAPVWGRDSRELFYVTTRGEELTRVPLIAKGDELALGTPEVLFVPPRGRWEPAYRDLDYDRARDRFLFTRAASGSDERRGFALSLGWASGLEARLRAKGGRP